MGNEKFDECCEISRSNNEFTQLQVIMEVKWKALFRILCNSKPPNIAI